MQFAKIAIDRELRLGRDDRVACDSGFTLDRDNARRKSCFSLRDGKFRYSAILGDAGGKAGKWSIRLRKLQAAKAISIERRRRVGRRRMPSQRHYRAIRQILLDLARQSAIELTKDDADSGIGVAREQGGVEIELIVTR